VTLALPLPSIRPYSQKWSLSHATGVTSPDISVETVHYVTTSATKDEMIEEIMANHNATIAATATSIQLGAETIVECEVSNKDFVQSSE
jgi:hypothetical protein